MERDKRLEDNSCWKLGFQTQMDWLLCVQKWAPLQQNVHAKMLLIFPVLEFMYFSPANLYSVSASLCSHSLCRMQDAISNVALFPYEHMIANNKDNSTLPGSFAHHISNMHNRRKSLHWVIDNGHFRILLYCVSHSKPACVASSFSCCIALFSIFLSSSSSAWQHDAVKFMIGVFCREGSYMTLKQICAFFSFFIKKPYHHFCLQL